MVQLNGSSTNRRGYTGGKCQFKAGLNQQTLSVQIEAERWRGVVVERSEVCGVVYYCQTNGIGHIHREPFQVDAICWQSCIFSIDRWSRAKEGVARRAGAMVWLFGMRFVSVVRRLCGSARVRRGIGMVAEGSRKRIATREQCGVKPEYNPSQHQGHASRSTQTPCPPSLRHPGDTSR